MKAEIQRLKILQIIPIRKPCIENQREITSYCN